MDYLRWKDGFRADTETDFDAKYYRGLRGRAKLFWSRRLITSALGRFVRGGRVLEVPCGSGKLLRSCARHAETVVGADISQGMLKSARGFPRVKCDIERLPFRGGAFRAVVSVRLMHRLGEEKRDAVLREMARVATGPILVQFKSARAVKHWWRRLWRRPPREGRVIAGDLALRASRLSLAWGGILSTTAGLSEDIVAVFHRAFMPDDD